MLMDQRDTILVVDDDRVYRHFVKSMLSPRFNVIETDNVDSALHLIVEHRPKVAILDIMSGDKITGLALCHHIKSKDETKNIKVILMTGTWEVLRDNAGNILADDFLVKPLNKQQVIYSVESCINESK